MINIRSILKLANNDGLTLKYGKITTYKLAANLDAVIAVYKAEPFSFAR